MKEEIKKELQTTQRRIMGWSYGRKEKSGTCYAAAHGASVDDGADSEPTTLTTNQRRTRLRPTPKTPTERAESSHDVDSNPSFDSVSQDEATEDVPELWVDCTVRATHKADDLMTANGIKPWVLRQSELYWKQARMIAKHHDDRWTRLIAKWSPTISTKQRRYWKRGRPANSWENDINSNRQPTQACDENNDLTNVNCSTTQLDMGPLGKRFREQTSTCNRQHMSRNGHNENHERNPRRHQRRHTISPFPDF